MAESQTVDYSQEVVFNLRKIIRAIELYSRQMVKKYGITTPQMMLLKELSHSAGMTSGLLADKICLSQATITTLLDRLESKKLISRVRDQVDKRKVHVYITEEGRKITDSNPSILEDTFTKKFDELQDWEKSYILSAIQRLAAMMESENIKHQLLTN